MSALARNRFKTNTRIADERLLVCLSRLICPTNSAVLVPSFLAISRKPCQNSFSNDTLVLFPFTSIERLIMVFIVTASSQSTQAVFARWLSSDFFGSSWALNHKSS